MQRCPVVAGIHNGSGIVLFRAAHRVCVDGQVPGQCAEVHAEVCVCGPAHIVGITIQCEYGGERLHIDSAATHGESHVIDDVVIIGINPNSGAFAVAEGVAAGITDVAMCIF